MRWHIWLNRVNSTSHERSYVTQLSRFKKSLCIAWRAQVTRASQAPRLCMSKLSEQQRQKRNKTRYSDCDKSSFLLMRFIKRWLIPYTCFKLFLATITITFFSSIWYHFFLLFQQTCRYRKGNATEGICRLPVNLFGVLAGIPRINER